MQRQLNNTIVAGPSPKFKSSRGDKTIMKLPIVNEIPAMQISSRLIIGLYMHIVTN